MADASPSTRLFDDGTTQQLTLASRVLDVIQNKRRKLFGAMTHKHLVHKALPVLRNLAIHGLSCHCSPRFWQMGQRYSWQHSMTATNHPPDHKEIRAWGDGSTGQHYATQGIAPDDGELQLFIHNSIARLYWNICRIPACSKKWIYVPVSAHSNRTRTVRTSAMGPICTIYACKRGEHPSQHNMAIQRELDNYLYLCYMCNENKACRDSTILGTAHETTYVQSNAWMKATDSRRKTTTTKETIALCLDISIV